MGREQIDAKHKCVKKTITTQTGRVENGAVKTVTELLAALTPQQYQHLVGFARLRMRARIQSRAVQRCLALIEPEDLVGEAVLKLELGDQNPALGRHLPPEYRTDLERFLACLRGVIESDLYNLVRLAEHRQEHVPLGDPELEPGTVELTAGENLAALLSRRDVHRVLFQKLHKSLERQPALRKEVQDWAERFLHDDRIGEGEENRDRVYRVRLLAKEFLTELAEELEIAQPTGREMIF